MITCWVTGPVFVTVTGQEASAPGSAVKLSWFADSRSVGPVTAGPVATGPVAADPVAADPVAADPVAAGPVAAARPAGAHAASSTALRVSSMPEPCSVAGAPRSVAVDS